MNESNTRPFYYSQVRVASEESRSRLLVVDAGARVERRRQDARQRDERHPRRPPRDVDRPERSRPLRSSATTAAWRSRWTAAATYVFAEQLRDRAVLQGELRLRDAVQRLRRAAGQRLVVRPEPPARRAGHERELVHGRRRRRLLHAAGSRPIRTSSTASRRAARSAGWTTRRGRAPFSSSRRGARATTVRGLDARRARRHDGEADAGADKTRIADLRARQKRRLGRRSICASTGTRRTSSRRTTRRRSTSAATACSSRRSAATTCSPISPDLSTRDTVKIRV